MIAPAPAHSSAGAPAEQLRALMAEHGLTQREVASIACVAVKTVEGWLAEEGAASHRNMHPRHLAMIRAHLPGFLAARRASPQP